MSNYQIAASILSADFARLGDDAKAVLEAGADLLHFDVMDNHFVPNLTIGPLVCKALRDFGITEEISVHLMVDSTDRLIVDFAKAGANEIFIHPESTQDIEKSLQLIKENGCKVGLALNPETSADYVQKYIKHLDNILVMTVHPGFGGQKFIKDVLKKIRYIRHEILAQSEYSPNLSVDGGVHIDNIAEIALAGANMFVSGSAIFNTPSYKDTIHSMRVKLQK